MTERKGGEIAGRQKKGTGRPNAGLGGVLGGRMSTGDKIRG